MNADIERKGRDFSAIAQFFKQVLGLTLCIKTAHGSLVYTSSIHWNSFSADITRTTEPGHSI